MKRRDPPRDLSRRDALGLASMALVGFPSLAGCTGDGSDPSPTVSISSPDSPTVSTSSPDVTGADVTVGYGETKFVTLTGKNIRLMYFSSAPADVGYAPIDFSIGRVTSEPSRSSYLDSMPPQWEWIPPAQEVKVTVPVSAPENGSGASTESGPGFSTDHVPPGSHEFTVTGTQDDQSAEASLVIHVPSDSTTEG